MWGAKKTGRFEDDRQRIERELQAARRRARDLQRTVARLGPLADPAALKPPPRSPPAAAPDAAAGDIARAGAAGAHDDRFTGYLASSLEARHLPPRRPGAGPTRGKVTLIVALALLVLIWLVKVLGQSGTAPTAGY